MKCENCGEIFPKVGNMAVRITGEKITVCPNCGREEIVIKRAKKNLRK